MEKSLEKKKASRRRRVLHVRKKIHGTLAKPRMSVFRSNRHLYVQLIDDDKGQTIFSLGTLAKEFRGSDLGKKGKESAKILGKKIAEKAKEKSITHVVFDRGRFHYHGIIAELANAARQEGLQF